MEDFPDMVQWIESLDFSSWRFSENAYSSWLKLRDEEQFVLYLDSACCLICESQNENPLTPNEIDALDHVREVAFAKALEATSNDELAACVGDDIELLAYAARVGVEDDWLKSLRHVYEEGRFPYGTLGSV